MRRQGAGLLCACALVLMHGAVAAAAPAADPRIQQLPYRPDAVYPLTGRAGYVLDIRFAPGERLVGVASGDAQAISIESQDNHLFLKPKAAPVQTNLTVLTTLRPYHFDYRVPRADATGPTPSLYALEFQYPEPPAALAAAQARQRVAELLDAPAAVRNENYWYCGDAQLKPEAVNDDGVQTRFTFPARGELPVIFLKNADGSESIVNTTVTDHGVTVHRVAERFILRRGRLVGCVVNRGDTRQGVALSGGAVSPAVQRQVPDPDGAGAAASAGARP